MSKLSNTLLMLKLLSNGTKYSTKQLADKLETSERMVRHYKEELEKAGIFLDTIHGPYGGYVLNNNINIPKIKFTQDDINLLDRIITNTKDNNEKINLINLRSKIILLNKESSNTNLLKDDNLRKYNLINKAINENKKISISFISKNTKKERIVTPLELFIYNSKWFIIVEYNEQQNDIRYLNLDRINDLKII